MYPQEATLVAILEAFAINDMFMRGMSLVDAMRRIYGLEVSHGPMAAHFWEKVLALCELTTPMDGLTGGNTALEVFDSVWAHVRSLQEQVPTTGHMYSLRMKQLARSKRNEELIALAEEIDRSLIDEYKGQLIRGCLSRAGGFKSSHKGAVLDAARLLEPKYPSLATLIVELESELNKKSSAMGCSATTTVVGTADPKAVGANVAMS
jgi:hypothetical protein